MNGYLVIYWNKDEGVDRLQRCDEVEIWKVIDIAKERGLLISVYRLSECVLDWS